MMKTILKQLKNGLLVSCQPQPGTALSGSEIMSIMAIAAEKGGAVGLRANGPADIRAIKQVSSLPLVGVNKVYKGIPTAADVIITPSYEAAVEIIEAGCDILGIDCTARGRSYDDVNRIIEAIKKHYPDIPIMADISTLEEGIMAAKMGVDILSTTLSGYTNTSLGMSEEEARNFSRYPSGQEPLPDFQLISDLRKHCDLLINAEGRFWEIAEIQKAFTSSADMLTVGTAITSPQLITKRFVTAINEISPK